VHRVVWFVALLESMVFVWHTFEREKSESHAQFRYRGIAPKAHTDLGPVLLFHPPLSVC
jgi:hypothetical protein